MPNWVTNTLSIIGTPEVIAQMRAQLSAPYEVSHYDFFREETEIVKVEKPFSFWNIIKPTDLEAYNDGKGKSQEGADHWYNWNIRNWGTKWEASEVQTSESPESLGFGFDTAWTPPIEAIDKLAEQYPTAYIELAYTEEQGWGGAIEWKDGMGPNETDSYEYKCWECGEKFQSLPEVKFAEETGEHLCKDKEAL